MDANSTPRAEKVIIRGKPKWIIALPENYSEENIESIITTRTGELPPHFHYEKIYKGSLNSLSSSNKKDPIAAFDYEVVEPLRNLDRKFDMGRHGRIAIIFSFDDFPSAEVFDSVVRAKCNTDRIYYFCSNPNPTKGKSPVELGCEITECSQCTKKPSECIHNCMERFYSTLSSNLAL